MFVGQLCFLTLKQYYVLLRRFMVCCNIIYCPMADNAVLNFLGCYPVALNILMELAQEDKGIRCFNILNNIPVEMTDDFVPCKDWVVNVINCYEDRPDCVPDGAYALAVVGGRPKEIVYNFFKDMFGYGKGEFVNLIHPSSYVSRSARLDYGLQVEQLTTIAACARIGFGVNIKRNCNIGHHCHLEDFVTINPGVTMSSFVRVGKKTMIGSGSVIKDNISIGSNSVIGVGSVVVKDIPSDCVAFGNPCRVYKIRE